MGNASSLIMTPLKGVRSSQLFPSAPLDRQIVQRDDVNSGLIPVTGTFTNPGGIRRIEAKATALTGGTTTGWQKIPTSRNAFSGNLVALGGWYSVTIRAINQANGIAGSKTISHVGVGDVFIIAGQSLSANYGNIRNNVSDERINCRSNANPWHLADDPQLNDGPASGTAGSIWPFFGDNLITRLNSGLGYPIGFLSIGVADSSTDRWLPTHNDLYPFFKQALSLFPINGFRAIIWLQGERDTGNGVSTATYYSNMVAIINATRSDSHWSVPWGIGSPETYQNAVTPTNQAKIAAAQAQLITNGVAQFFVDMDNNIPLIDRYDGTHPNQAAQAILGPLWVTAMINYFGLT